MKLGNVANISVEQVRSIRIQSTSSPILSVPGCLKSKVDTDTISIFANYICSKSNAQADEIGDIENISVRKMNERKDIMDEINILVNIFV